MRWGWLPDLQRPAASSRRSVWHPGWPGGQPSPVVWLGHRTWPPALLLGSKLLQLMIWQLVLSRGAPPTLTTK